MPFSRKEAGKTLSERKKRRKEGRKEGGKFARNLNSVARARRSSFSALIVHPVDRETRGKRRVGESNALGRAIVSCRETPDCDAYNATIVSTFAVPVLIPLPRAPLPRKLLNSALSRGISRLLGPLKVGRRYRRYAIRGSGANIPSPLTPFPSDIPNGRY